MTCRRTLTPSSSIMPRMLQTWYPISCLQKPNPNLRKWETILYSFMQQSHIIRVTGALHSTGASIIRATSGSGLSASCAARFRPRFPLPFITSSTERATSGSGLSGSGSSASSAALLRFRPRFPLSAVASSASASSASGIVLLRFLPHLPLPLASLAVSFSVRFARTS
jgi:hypothetical protein